VLSPKKSRMPKIEATDRESDRFIGGGEGGGEQPAKGVWKCSKSHSAARP